MRTVASLIFLAVCTFARSASTSAGEPRQPATVRRADIVIYGATASGVIAAVAAAREGRSVLLIEPGKHPGGMVSGGLGATDTGNRQAIGGYAREFFDRVREHYTATYGAKSQQVKDCSDGFRFEPHVAELIFTKMLREAKVVPLYQSRLRQVLRSGGRISGIVVQSPAGHGRVEGRIFIDASYEGDLMAGAKVGYTLGRESRQEYKESIAGVQKYSAAHQWGVKVSPFDGRKRLLLLVQEGVAGEPGAGDKKIQAYNFRLCLTQDPEQLTPFPKPANYDPARYELLARYLAKRPDLKVGQLMHPVRMPNAKTDTNNNGPFSTDHIGANWDYPEADDAGRQRIWQDHIDYTQGFLYFLGHDPRVPPPVRKEMNTWGLARGEFTDNHNWPHQLYVREARRMKGAYVMTQADIMEKRTKDDSVGLGSYNTDSHHVQRIVVPDGFVLNEGDFQVGVKPYAIPYRSLIPREGECDNLLVPVCMSASHVAYGTIRMEPVYMILGQAAGVAASLALQDEAAVQKVALAKLHAKLKIQKAVLSPVGLSAPGVRGLDPGKLPGIVVDDVDAAKTGDWIASTSTTPFVGQGYLHDNNQEQGKRRVRFTPKIVSAGRYDVRLYYSPHANRATNVMVVVHHEDGDTVVRVNQRKPPNGGNPLLLGTFAFAAGTVGYVEIRNDQADGYVIADAVQWLPASAR
jgi:hypothetical protein